MVRSELMCFDVFLRKGRVEREGYYRGARPIVDKL